MSFYKQVSNKADEFLVNIFDGPKVGAYADIAAEITRALVNESERLGDRGRFHVLSLTIARNSLLLRVKLDEKQMDNPEPYLRELRTIMGSMANDIYSKHRMGIKD